MKPYQFNQKNFVRNASGALEPCRSIASILALRIVVIEDGMVSDAVEKPSKDAWMLMTCLMTNKTSTMLLYNPDQGVLLVRSWTDKKVISPDDVDAPAGMYFNEMDKTLLEAALSDWTERGTPQEQDRIITENIPGVHSHPVWVGTGTGATTDHNHITGPYYPSTTDGSGGWASPWTTNTGNTTQYVSINTNVGTTP